jgi:ethanolamine transporter
MTFNDVILFVMAVGIILGVIDKIIGNRFGLGAKLEEGLKAMGPLAIGMVGIICLAPVISNGIGPIIGPICRAVGIDPAMLGSILACDMGGYPLAMGLADNEQMGLFSGIIVASMLGCAITFIIPVGFSMIEKQDQPFFAKGLLVGLITVPVGSVAGGLAAGFDPGLVLVNTIPVLIISVLLAIGLKAIPEAMIKGSIYFGKFIEAIILIGLAAAGFESLTGIVIIPGMAPIGEAMEIIGAIATVLMGTLPILHIFLLLLDKPLKAVGNKIGITTTDSAGVIIDLANGVPVYVMFKDMSNRGKVINIAFMVPAACILGDHLGFTAGVRPDMITPLIIGKAVGGVVALVAAYLLSRNLDTEIKQSKAIKAKLEVAK